MKILDVLRKLGIPRFGAESAVYRDATERKASLQMDGVFDSEKDLVGRKVPDREERERQDRGPRR
jgi:hypothetical protein